LPFWPVLMLAGSMVKFCASTAGSSDLRYEHMLRYTKGKDSHG
jgi:hypothetical protein